MTSALSIIMICGYTLQMNEKAQKNTDLCSKAKKMWLTSMSLNNIILMIGLCTNVNNYKIVALAITVCILIASVIYEEVINRRCEKDMEPLTKAVLGRAIGVDKLRGCEGLTVSFSLDGWVAYILVHKENSVEPYRIESREVYTYLRGLSNYKSYYLSRDYLEYYGFISKSNSIY